MKVLLVNGSPHENGCTSAALEACAETLREKGIETELLWLGESGVKDCIACGKCRRQGKCVLPDDAVNEVSARADKIDGFIFGGPVYYGEPCAGLQAFMDRLFRSAGERLAGKPAAAVVSCRRKGAAVSFERLNRHFETSCMPVVTSWSFNQIHGNTPQEARQDLEGLQTMRTLALNMAWLLLCIEAGRAAGIEKPVYEPKIVTGFIR